MLAAAGARPSRPSFRFKRPTFNVLTRVFGAIRARPSCLDLNGVSLCSTLKLDRARNAAGVKSLGHGALAYWCTKVIRCEARLAIKKDCLSHTNDATKYKVCARTGGERLRLLCSYTVAHGVRSITPSVERSGARDHPAMKTTTLHHSALACVVRPSSTAMSLAWLAIDAARPSLIRTIYPLLTIAREFRYAYPDHEDSAAFVYAV